MRVMGEITPMTLNPLMSLNLPILPILPNLPNLPNLPILPTLPIPPIPPTPPIPLILPIIPILPINPNEFSHGAETIKPFFRSRKPKSSMTSLSASRISISRKETAPLTR